MSAALHHAGCAPPAAQTAFQSFEVAPVEGAGRGPCAAPRDRVPRSAAWVSCRSAGGLSRCASPRPPPRLHLLRGGRFSGPAQDRVHHRGKDERRLMRGEETNQTGELDQDLRLRLNFEHVQPVGRGLLKSLDPLATRGQTIERSQVGLGSVLASSLALRFTPVMFAVTVGGAMLVASGSSRIRKHFLTRRLFFKTTALFAAAQLPFHASATSGGRYIGKIVTEWLPDGRNMVIVHAFEYIDPEGRKW